MERCDAGGCHCYDGEHTIAISRAAEDMAVRLTVSLTLTLTAAAYKVAIESMTPNIGYLTLLDKYVLGCALFIALTVFE